MAHEHLVIRRDRFVAGSFERPEVGVFTQTHTRRHPVPWGRIASGDRIWMKWSGGPLVAQARVTGYREIEHGTPDVLRESTRGFQLHDLRSYWERLPPEFAGLTIYLNEERWLDPLHIRLA
jgi:hypothetical protein